jgi:hypothetical protein
MSDRAGILIRFSARHNFRKPGTAPFSAYPHMFFDKTREADAINKPVNWDKTWANFGEHFQ